jgi:hypothetical protein
LKFLATLQPPFFSTLPSDPEDPHSWNQHVASVKIDKSTTTLLSVINGILEEKHHLTEDSTNAQKQELALATLEQGDCNHGKPFCRNHMHEGHSNQDCCGIGVPKEQQRLTKKKLRGKKRGKEKAHNTTDGEGGDLGSEDKDSCLVKFKKCLTTNITNFSHYSQFDSNSLSSLTNPKV